MAAVSAGLLLYRDAASVVEVLLVHPGGPLWARRDAGAWQIPKGEIDPGEDALAAAVREAREELGEVTIEGEFLPLTPIQQRGGKRVLAWAVRAAFDPATLRSNTFRMEWPPRSGRVGEFPEVDRAAWYSLEAARARILPAQAALLDELAARLEQRA